ncbi:MAG: Zn-dependent hydrolase [Gammaproteobacteria bacterium]|nr:Zn-dependent hydrolase [Gammaproteobacteria bacterium]
MRTRMAALSVSALLVLAACGKQPVEAPASAPVLTEKQQYAEQRVSIYAPFRLTTDISEFSPGKREMLKLLIEAAQIMDDLFWRQAWGDKAALLNSIDNEATRRLAVMNYGPWDRLAGDRSFVDGIEDKPLGANLYPRDMTKEEFEAADLEGKASQYTVLERGADGGLKVVPYSQAFPTELRRAAGLLNQAANLAEDPGFANYLRLRAKALLSDDYLDSDMAWMDMKSNTVDLVYGPIETYEDKLFGYKASFEAYVLIKDVAWSERLARYASFLPELQLGLPVPEAYKAEVPGTDSDLNAYDVVFYAGDCNAGSKTIAINLPNDEQVQLAKGTRRLQLKNAMQAKFDNILVPIADQLIAADQRQHVVFDAFFANTMFHEVAHGLGIKNTVNGKGLVRTALRDLAGAVEEGKADVLGLYMIKSLFEKGEITQGELMDYYVTFVASIFRSVRFGASSAHGRANMVRFNFFQDRGAFLRDPETGRYRVDKAAMEQAMAELSARILTLQGDGDYEGVTAMMEELEVIRPSLQADLDKLTVANIPVDIVFEQGAEVMGL